MIYSIALSICSVYFYYQFHIAVSSSLCTASSTGMLPNAD